MKVRVFIVRTEGDMRAVRDEKGLDKLDYSDCTLRYSARYRGHTCRIRIDGTRCHRFVFGGIRTPMWVNA